MYSAISPAALHFEADFGSDNNLPRRSISYQNSSQWPGDCEGDGGGK
jgi:hypothetical protein